MIVKKFTAATTREALLQVREVLGPEALILSNRVQDGQVEIMAMAENDMAALTASPTPVAPRPPANNTHAMPLRHDIPGLQVLSSNNPQARSQTPTATAKPATSAHNATPADNLADNPATAAAPAAMQAESAQLVENLTLEVQSIRSLIESQLVNLAWGEMKNADPQKFDVLRTLLGVGFSPRLARELSGALPKALNHDQALRWMNSALAHNLHCAGSRDEPIAHGGVYALVGPTGVGKTTTIAKLAARCVLKFGAPSLALITTDSYRIGAHEQLKIYGKILNVPVYAVKDEAELNRTLKDLSHKHLVLIDSAGMSQRDHRIREQLALLSGNPRVQRLLLLSATAQAGTLDDVVRAYQGSGFAGTILTKIDEALSLAPVLDVAVRHKLTIHYVTNGQRVPEDLHLAQAHYLVDRAMKSTPQAPHQAHDNEYPIMISAREDEAHAFLDASQAAS
jgi:flagellar biosynthesis protein FlhF